MRFVLDGLEVFFPYDYVYREQYQYMLELKRALDARGHGILEMPTGTGKTVSLLSLITAYQAAHPDTVGKLIYCTRTVPEMSKTVEELKRVIEYRAAQLAAAGQPPAPDVLAVCLSSRRNLCIHPSLGDESDKEKVDAGCRSMTASWVRARAQAARDAGASRGGGAPPPPTLCEFFEGWDASGTDAEIRGIYTLDDLKALGAAKGWCPYFTARHVISYANVVVYNYQVREGGQGGHGLGGGSTGRTGGGNVVTISSCSSAAVCPAHHRPTAPRLPPPPPSTAAAAAAVHAGPQDRVARVQGPGRPVDRRV
jgi:DNA excision repair protein ERCC-2